MLTCYFIMNKNTIVDIANSILGLSREKKKELINLLVELYNRKEFQNVEQKINDNLQASKDYADGKIQEAINNLIDGAPEAYDTLKEIATALGDEGVVGQLLQTIGQKLDASDYIQTDWNQNDNTKKDFIKNRTHYSQRELQLTEIILNSQTNDLTYTINNGIVTIYNNGVELPFVGRQGILDQSNGLGGTAYNIEDVLCTDNNLPAYDLGRKITLTFRTLDNSKGVLSIAWMDGGRIKTRLSSVASGTSISNGLAYLPSDGYLYSIKGYADIESVQKLDKKYLPYEGSDWNEEDATKLEYIKNRPIYDYSTENQQTKVINVNNNGSVYLAIQPDNTIKSLYAKRINVVDGTHFDLEFYIGAAGTVFDENTFEKINNLVGCVDGTTDFISGSYGKHYVIFNKNKPSERLQITWYNGNIGLKNFGLIFKDSNETGYFSIDSMGDIDTRLRQVDSLGDIFRINVSLSGNIVEFAPVNLIYTEVIRHLKQLDTKYIPNSIIQRIEALESIVQQLQGYHQE